MLRSRIILGTFCASTLLGAPPDRITRLVDSQHTRVVTGSLHRLAAPQFDKGPVDPGMRMEYMQIFAKPSATQQAGLDQLLADQQNPSSKQFHKWLTPEEFGNRFGLSPGDHAKIVAWLQAEGFFINELARGRNWVAFSGTADQVSRSLHTSIHRYQVNGETHFANLTELSVPEALADVTGGFIGLNDFKLTSQSEPHLIPEYNAGSNHNLIPADFATIYNISPLYQAGLDGAGASIAVIGGSNVLLSDLASFQKSLNLPANVPKIILYGGSDPGFNNGWEGTHDLEWAGAIAPKASIYYVYGADFHAALAAAINANYAPIISYSGAGCEINFLASQYRYIAQQANAQGITILAASGDVGAAGCDVNGGFYSTVWAEQGESVDYPAVLPEVTGVGGTTFVEGSGTYWAASNDPANFGSALSYIPETSWNQSSTFGLGASGGGASRYYSRPAWQTAPGVPNDNARHVPDIAFSASTHDAYLAIYQGAVGSGGGTSWGAPAMAAIVALLNQYQIKNGFQAKPGLGNINPQLYRLAQSAPSVFHDITTGNNIVNCGPGTPDCLTSPGVFGYSAGPGYDMVTGLGSIDVNALFTQWNTAAKGATVALTASTAKPTTNDTIQLTASVNSADGTGSPTGTVSFTEGTQFLGSITLGGDGTASVTFPAYLAGTGTISVYAEYSGDAMFSSGGAGAKIQIAAPSGVASIIPSAPDNVYPNAPDAAGLGWPTTLTLKEVAGVAAILTGFTIDGETQPLAQYFPTVNIVPNGSISSTFVLRNQAIPLTHTYGFTGVDAGGQNWSRQVAVNYSALRPNSPNSTFTATPPVVVQDTTADPSCQWRVQIHDDDAEGYWTVFTGLYSGGLYPFDAKNLTGQIDSIFGTTRLDAYGSLSGAICFGGITPPATETITLLGSDAVGSGEIATTVTFVGPPAHPAKITASPASLNLVKPSASQPGQATLSIGLSDPTQPWTASVFPANRTTSWLSVSQLSGVGPTDIVLTGRGTEFENGAYGANIVLQCMNCIPQSVTVPVMFVVGGSTTGTVITGVANSATFQGGVAPGMLLSVFGTNLSKSTSTAPGFNGLQFSTGGVSATVNGSWAPVLYASPNQLNIQVPYEAGAGPALLSINSSGQTAGFQFDIAPSAPGIFSDGAGNLAPKSTATAGGNATFFVNGAGDGSPLPYTGFWGTGAPATLPKPILPLSVTVGGVSAFLQFFGMPTGTLGTTQVNFIVPSSLAPGVYPVVVTVGGVSSPPVNLTVTQ
jgi:uncharacterized protein (TIGR03437 family)